jgi:hypothetical protein
MFRTKRLALGSAALTMAVGTCAAQEQFDLEYSRPALDRWMYPFNSQPGMEVSAPAFGAIEISGFDDRDAQFLVGFNTGAQVPPGRQLSRYQVISARLVLFVSVDLQAQYDPTYDTINGLLQVADPDYVPDSDPGRPMEVFAAGYRNSWTSETFLETSIFGGAPIIPPSEGARNVFAALPTDCGETTDLSRQVRQRFDAQPMSIGLCPTLSAGDWIPEGTRVEFDIDFSDAETVKYFQRSFSDGRLRLIVSSLEPASGGPGGGTGTPTYPAFYTKENPLSEPLGYFPRLELTIDVFAAADFNLDGFVDGIDYDLFNNAFETGDLAADFNNDCFVDGIDYDRFNGAFEGD